LTKHNEYRARHGAPKLKIDPVLQQFAQSYVRKCLGMVHSGKYSENLAGGGPPNTDYNKVLGQSVDMWYNEIKDYNFNNPGFSMKTGHFTQVVWNAATKIGCGYHNCLDGQGPFTGWLVSCNYDQGNMPGEFPWNVKPVR
ncbi:CAP domain-containing protein, partial [Peziza echinospora]